MACICAPAIVAEMKDWVALGGANSGCCGNAAHTYGFHREASAVPVSDYSRSHEAAKPKNMSWACAGDFSHGNKTALRAKHLTLLNRLMAGDAKLSMICEFIGKPWPDKPVYYWARWNGVKTLQKYTGSGHDHWSHISWWRSRADQRAYLWKPGSVTPTPKPAPVGPLVAPKYPGYVMKRADPPKYDANVKIFQNQMRALGWTSIGAADGLFGQTTENVVKAFQKLKKLTADGIVGPMTWAAAWAK